MGLRIKLFALILPFICPFFYPVFFVFVFRLLRIRVKAKFVSPFSLELCKLESSNKVYICRMSDCIVGLRLRVMAPIFLFFVHFSFFPKLQVNIKNLCQSFLRNF